MTELSPIVRRLLLHVPEIRPFLDGGIRSWEEASGGTPPTDDYIFGSLLALYTAELLRKTEDHTETLRKILEFLEKQLESSNEWERNLVEVSFCEQFAEERDVLGQALREMGPRLSKSMNELLG